MNQQPILSICIPTYNRGVFLKKSLEAYVNNKAFDEDVEIVISDNHSTDDTQQICKYYAEKYNNIRYYRNEENIRDANFPLALDRGQGLYVKLMNDNNVITEEGLSYLKNKILKYKDDKKQLFFTNGIVFNHEKSDEVECNSFGDFVKNLSYYVTAIHVFGAWKEDWNKVESKSKFSFFQLAQDDWSYQIIREKKCCFLCPKEYFWCQSVGKRGGYNWVKVHIDNYYEILQHYVDEGLISNKDLLKEKVIHLSMIKGAIYKSITKDMFHTTEFRYNGSIRILFKRFGNVPYFYFLLFTAPYKFVQFIIKRVFPKSKYA